MNNYKTSYRVVLTALILESFVLAYIGMQSFTGDNKQRFDYNPVPTINNAPNRSINTSFQPVSIRGTFGSYTATITTSVSLLNLNSSGKVFLEVSPDNVNWTTINSAGEATTLAVAVSVGVNKTTDYNIQGMIPKGYYCRLRTTTSGGATVVMSSGQETMF